MISVGLIGCGDVAENGHVPALARHPRFRIAAVCDISSERAALLSGLAGGVPSYADWSKLLFSEKLDAVVIALPPEISTEVAIGCLERNLAVLDEKPLAATLVDGQRLARIVNEGKHVYQSGFVLRYGDWVREIGRLAKSLGLPLKMKAEIYDERWNPENEIHFSRIQNFLKNSTALTHEGSHVIDYAGLWNPSPWTSVSAFAQRTSPTFCGPNVWNAHVELADLSTLTVKVGWLLPQLPESTISVQGPAGQIHFNCVTGEGTYEIDSEREELIFRPAAPEWDRQYDAFADAIDRGTAVSATVNDALKALEVTAAGELSAQKGMQINRGELYKQAAAQQLGAAPKSATQMDNWLTA